MTLVGAKSLTAGANINGRMVCCDLDAISLGGSVESSGTLDLFHVGQMVRLRADTHRFGPITEGPRAYVGGTEYAVFFKDGTGVPEWISGLLLEPLILPNGNKQIRPIDGSRLLRNLALAKLSRPLTDGLYAFGASRTHFEVYQFRPVLKFLHTWMSGGKGLLVADEVGLGKTIEAAIIHQEIKARVDVHRAVVLCPSRLTAKWQEELASRFGEQFSILDATSMRRHLHDIERFGDAVRFKIIASFEMLRRQEFIEALVKSNISIDFLVIDEAHHLRNEGTRTHQLGEAMTASADAILLLSATPLHLGSKDLFNLLQLIAPEEFEDLVFFEALLDPNRFINEAARQIAAGDAAGALSVLRRVETTSLRERFRSNPVYAECVKKLQSINGDSPLEERVAIQRQVMELNTLSNLVTRTRKREFSQAALREPHTVLVPLTDDERAFYNGVLHQTRMQLQSTGKDARGFATIMRERQAASCLPAMRQILAELVTHPHKSIGLGAEQGALDLSFGDSSPSLAGGLGEGWDRRAQRDLLSLAEHIGDQDSKYKQLRHTLLTVLNEDEDRKVLVFSFFRHTLEYLRKRLQMDGIPISVIHGEIKPLARHRIIEEFRVGTSSRVLLSSEVGAEGLDFQFCDVLVNYDLPWNPMQVEQRIGRLDRFGQKAAKIRIFNFFLEDTIETRILERLYDRIEVFKHAIGDLEDIMGEVIRDLRLEVLQPNLTAEQEQSLADNAARRIENERQEREQFARHEQELLGQGNLLDQRVDAAIESGRVIRPRELDALVGTFLREAHPTADYATDHDEPCATVRFAPDLSQRFDRYLEKYRLQLDPSSPVMQAHAKHGRLALTFDSELARQRPSLEFVNVYHPLARMALEYWQESQAGGSEGSVTPAYLEVFGSMQEAGNAWFFVFSVSVHAVNHREVLEVIVLHESDGRILEQTQRQLLRLVQDQALTSRTGDPFPAEDFERWRKQAEAYMASRRDEIKAEESMKNLAAINMRRASLEASIDAKLRRIERISSNTDDPRIQRMYSGQVRNLIARKEQASRNLERYRDVAITTRLITGGRLLIWPHAHRQAPPALAKTSQVMSRSYPGVEVDGEQLAAVVPANGDRSVEEHEPGLVTRLMRNWSRGK